jgi:hypothetical protein
MYFPDEAYGQVSPDDARTSSSADARFGRTHGPGPEVVNVRVASDSAPVAYRVKVARHNDWRSAAWSRRSGATEGHVSCNSRVMRLDVLWL